MRSLPFNTAASYCAASDLPMRPTALKLELDSLLPVAPVCPGPMIALGLWLITAHHSVSSPALLAKRRHIQGSSAELAVWTRPAACDVTFTSRWRKSSERIEPRTYSADASFDRTSITPRRAMTSLVASVDPTRRAQRMTMSVSVRIGLSRTLEEDSQRNQVGRARQADSSALKCEFFGGVSHAT
jgi:hypothetical protein